MEKYAVEQDKELIKEAKSRNRFEGFGKSAPLWIEENCLCGGKLEWRGNTRWCSKGGTSCFEGNR